MARQRKLIRPSRRVGPLLRLAREAQGLTATEVARRAAMPLQTVSAIELGQKGCGPVRLKVLSGVLRLDAADVAARAGACPHCMGTGVSDG